VGRGPVGLPAADGLEVQRDRGVLPERDEPLGHEGRLAVLLEAFAVGLALHARRVLQDGLDRPVLPDEVARTLLTDAGNPRDVVHAVAHEGQDVHDPLGRHAPLRLDCGAVEPRGAAALAAGVQHRDVGRDELQEVLVGRDDYHAAALPHRLPRQRCDDVVRLVARHLDHRQPQGVADAPYERDLHGQVRVHGRAVRLVLRVLVVADGRAGRIEEDRDVLRPLVVEELSQHRREAVRRVRGEAPARGEPADRVERPVELAAAVHQVDGPPVALCRGHGRILLFG
jgi:hypothetical protein